MEFKELSWPLKINGLDYNDPFITMLEEAYQVDYNEPNVTCP